MEAPAIELRDYQSRMVREIYRAIHSGYRRIAVYLPTGGGKTILSGQIIADAISRGRRVLFLVDRDVLVAQTVSACGRFNVSAGIIKGNVREDRSQLLQVASVQTLNRGRSIPDYDLMIVDEAHTVSFYRIVRDLLENSQKISLGLSATPFRAKVDESMADYYDWLVKGPDPLDLMKSGDLVVPRYFSFRVPIDFSGVRIDQSTGDYRESDLQRVSNVDILNKKGLEAYQKLANGRQGMIFATGIDHSITLTEQFNKAGIATEHLDGSIGDRERERMFNRVKSGETRMLSSIDTIRVGYDEPLMAVGLIMRKTKSRVVHYQMKGRILRPHKTKHDAIFLDLVGNTKTLGRVDSPQDIALRPAKTDKSGQCPYKECSNCSALLFAWQRTCPECLHEFELQPIDVPDEKIEELLSDAELQQRDKLVCLARKSYEYNFKPGYSTVKFKEEFGVFPAAWWRRCSIFGVNPSPEDRVKYLHYLRFHANKNNLDSDWVSYWMEVEFGYVNEIIT